jgi:hypothetical protein
MDDPWGSSPWADEIQSIPSNNTFGKVDDDTTRTSSPVVKDNGLISDRSPQAGDSTWGNTGTEQDYNGFGEWADAPAEAGAGLDGAADAWRVDLGTTADNKLNQTSLRPNDGFEMAWTDAPFADEESKAHLSQNLRLNVAEATRQPSPDPWGFDEPSLGDEIRGTKEKVLESEDESIHTIFGLDGKENASAGREAIQSAPEPTDDLSDITETIESNLALDASSKLAASQADSADAQEDPHLSDAAIGSDGSSTTQVADPTSSRPSSSPSDGSRREETFVESPRTSLDEGPKRVPMPRQASKVHQLVEHFDTLAKREVTPGPEGERIYTTGESAHSSNDKQEEIDENAKSIQESEESGATHAESVDQDDGDEFGDFGDFEEGQSDEDELVTEEIDHKTGPISQHITSTILTDEAREGTLEDKMPYFNGPVEFKPDLALLDKIYVSLSEETSAEKVFIPDVIPHDSFASTEERKMWYRLSRYGPMRQHESGADDNYVRVNWAKSQVRDETLKVVARWIEEDRISGRVVLGGGSKAGSIFGWNDSKSKPASIAAAFAERNPRKKQGSISSLPGSEIPREWPKGLVRERSTSKGHSTSKPRRRSSVKPVKTIEDVNPINSGTIPTTVDFGWGSGTTPERPQKATSRSQSSHKASNSSGSRTLTQEPPSPAPLQSTINRPASLEATSMPNSHTPPSVSTTSRLDTIMSPPLTDSMIPNTSQSEVVFDADDWGEMISSPVVATAPTLPVQNTLRHKRSQSFGNIIATNKASTPLRMSLDQNNSTSMSSFVQILIPKSDTVPLAEAFGGPDLMTGPGISSHQIPSSEAFQNSNIAAPNSQPGDGDAWASADFSFFESAPAPAPAPVLKKKGISKVANTTRTQPSNLHAVASSTVNSSQKSSKIETEQDKTVKDILGNLPDLSYMLKR